MTLTYTITDVLLHSNTMSDDDLPWPLGFGAPLGEPPTSPETDDSPRSESNAEVQILGKRKRDDNGGGGDDDDDDDEQQGSNKTLVTDVLKACNNARYSIEQLSSKVKRTVVKPAAKAVKAKMQRLRDAAYAHWVSTCRKLAVAADEHEEEWQEFISANEAALAVSGPHVSKDETPQPSRPSKTDQSAPITPQRPNPLDDDSDHVYPPEPNHTITPRASDFDQGSFACSFCDQVFTLYLDFRKHKPSHYMMTGGAGPEGALSTDDEPIPVPQRGPSEDEDANMEEEEY